MPFVSVLPGPIGPGGFSKELEMKFYINTDARDLENSCIGIHPMGGTDREFCISIQHKGTKESVAVAQRLAHKLTETLNNLAGLNFTDDKETNQ